MRVAGHADHLHRRHVHAFGEDFTVAKLQDVPLTEAPHNLRAHMRGRIPADDFGGYPGGLVRARHFGGGLKVHGKCDAELTGGKFLIMLHDIAHDVPVTVHGVAQLREAEITRGGNGHVLEVGVIGRGNQPVIAQQPQVDEFPGARAYHQCIHEPVRLAPQALAVRAHRVRRGEQPARIAE